MHAFLRYENGESEPVDRLFPRHATAQQPFVSVQPSVPAQPAVSARPSVPARSTSSVKPAVTSGDNRCFKCQVDFSVQKQRQK